MVDRIDEVLSFWFGRVPGPRFGLLDALWLPTRIPCWGGHWAQRVYDVDGLIRRRFLLDWQRAAEGELDAWASTPRGRLALVLLLDQIGRNIHRGTPTAFSTDPKTYALAREAVERGEDRLFNPLARTLLYLPFMHQEELGAQDRCVALYTEARREAPHAAWLVLTVELLSARRHREIIARFGRFPHRNAILGRESTPEEQAFLRKAFSAF